MPFKISFTLINYFINRYLLNLILAIICLLFLYTIIIRWQITYSYALDIEGIEPNVIYSIQQILSGKSLYTDPEQMPFSITQYTPLYYFLCSYIAKIFNLDSIDNIHEIYVVGRSVSLFFSLLSLFVILLILRNIFSVDWKIIIISAFISFVFQYRWNCAVRPDSMLNFFVLLSVWLFLEYLNCIRHKKIFLIVAIFFAVASIFVKQSGIQLPIIFIFFLFIIKRWADLILAIISGFIVTAIFCSYFYYIYDNAFFDNTIGGIVNGITLQWFIKAIVYNKMFIFQIVAFAVVLAIFTIHLLQQHTLSLIFISYCAVAMFVFATLTALKFGSTIQYYVDFQNVSIIVILTYFLSIKNQIKTYSDKLIQNIFLSSLTVVIFSIGIVYFYLDLAKFTRRESERKAEFEKQQLIAKYIKHTLKIKTDEYILTFGSRYIIIGNFLHHNFAMPQRDIVNCCSYPLNVFDYSNFRKSLKSGKIKYYVVQNNSVENGIAAANFEDFIHITDLEGFSIFKHKNL